MSKMRYLALLGSVCFLVLGFSTPSFAGGKILVYSPWKDEIMQKFGGIFEKETGIKMESINISTGEIYARLKVEKARPQADVWHSVRAELLDKAKEEGLLAPYKPANAKYVLPEYAYPHESTFTGTTMYPLVLAYNVNTLKKMGMEPPKSYEDLLSPKWKDKIIMPHPAASGTGYAFLVTIIQLYREKGEGGIQSKKGWDYLVKLNQNMSQYTRSGSAPAKLVGSGEFPICVTFYDRVFQLASEGYPISFTTPTPTFAEPSCTAIVANAPNLEGAKKFMEFILSKKAQELAVSLGNYSVRPELDPPKGAPALKEMKIFQDDYKWGSKFKKELLNEFNTKVAMGKKTT
ncbi:MAG: ABC transporter substrate-binding protein [Deltaproteobacteria bacterium]|nr:ABC transporter substrate-binding protein [Deltaproteobacteria bacterium]